MTLYRFIQIIDLFNLAMLSIMGFFAGINFMEKDYFFFIIDVVICLLNWWILSTRLAKPMWSR